MRRLPEFDDKVSGALASLDPSRAQALRGLAAVGGDARGEMASRSGPIPDLTDAERELWLGWAEQRLNEAQFYMDVVDGQHGQKAVQRELSEIATALVAFHGYARQGRGDRMARTLERIQARSARARGLACKSVDVAKR